MKKILLMILCMALFLPLLSFSVTAEEAEPSEEESLTLDMTEQNETEETSVSEENEESEKNEEMEKLPEEGEAETAAAAEEREAAQGLSDPQEDQKDIIDNGIPVLTLTIDPEEFQKVVESSDHSYRAYTGSVRIDIPEGYESEFGEIDPDTISAELALEYIRGRGNSTWAVDKKPFKIKLDKSRDLLGMGKNKHWVLLANRGDSSLLRNRLVGYMGLQLGLEFTPLSLPVDFVVNGEYLGSYVLSQDVRIAKSRVNIDELTDEDIEEPEITGGYLLALNPYYYELPGNVFSTQRGIEFGTEEPIFESDDPEEEVNPREQYEYIKAYIQKTEDEIFSEEESRYAEYMDMEAAAKYWWVQEVTENSDGFNTPSTYLYKKRNGKLYWGPLWDFDLTMKMASNMDGLNHMKMEWLDHLRAYDPAYQDVLKAAWQEYDRVLLSITESGGILDQYAEEIRASWEMDYEVIGPYLGMETTLDAEVEYLRTFLERRRTWINENLETELARVYGKLIFLSDGEIIQSKTYRFGYSVRSSEYPEDPEKEGFTFAGWYDEEGNRIPDQVLIDDDEIRYYARFIPDEEVTRVSDVFLEPYEIWIGRNEIKGISFLAVPKDAMIQTISWEVSDPELLTVLVNGQKLYLSGKKTGDAEVIASLPTGDQKTFSVHIYDREETPKGIITSLSVQEEVLFLRTGEYGQMRMKAEPMPADISLKYESGDENVAGMEINGVVHAASRGTCTVKVTDTKSGLETEYTVVVGDPIDEAEITLSPSSMEYDGTEKKPNVTVKYQDQILQEGTDYTLAYEDNVKPGTARVIITGIGSYYGSAEKTFTIQKKDDSHEGSGASGTASPSSGVLSDSRYGSVNTADETHAGFWTASLLLSAFAAAACLQVLRKGAR